ncbi:hypothetical protein Bca4012_065645 [Brassica carinata]|uniref:Uncharacterized protein n=1 Tax=Brassica carinata TaxID=52824 RepID=A0A8X7VN12_BRACI|nr:hypothetical protein Bca52824_017960 [Brassica carinata]
MLLSYANFQMEESTASGTSHYNSAAKEPSLRLKDRGSRSLGETELELTERRFPSVLHVRTFCKESLTSFG